MPGELLDALASSSLKPEDIDQKNLPAELQKLSREELNARIANATKDRAALQKEIAEVSQQRADFIAKEAKRLAVTGKGDSFDENVGADNPQAGREKGHPLLGASPEVGFQPAREMLG